MESAAGQGGGFAAAIATESPTSVTLNLLRVSWDGSAAGQAIPKPPKKENGVARQFPFMSRIWLSGEWGSEYSFSKRTIRRGFASASCRRGKVECNLAMEAPIDVDITAIRVLQATTAPARGRLEMDFSMLFHETEGVADLLGFMKTAHDTFSETISLDVEINDGKEIALRRMSVQKCRQDRDMSIVDFSHLWSFKAHLPLRELTKASPQGELVRLKYLLARDDGQASKQKDVDRLECLYCRQPLQRTVDLLRHLKDEHDLWAELEKHPIQKSSGAWGVITVKHEINGESAAYRGTAPPTPMSSTEKSRSITSTPRQQDAKGYDSKQTDPASNLNARSDSGKIQGSLQMLEGNMSAASPNSAELARQTGEQKFTAAKSPITSKTIQPLNQKVESLTKTSDSAVITIDSDSENETQHQAKKVNHPTPLKPAKLVTPEALTVSDDQSNTGTDRSRSKSRKRDKSKSRSGGKASRWKASPPRSKPRFNLEVEPLPVVVKRKVPVPKAPSGVTFYRNMSKRPLMEGELLSDSDHEVDRTYTKLRHRQYLNKHSNATPAEKEFMRLFNEHFQEERHSGDKYIGEGLIRFAMKEQGTLRCADMYQLFCTQAAILKMENVVSEAQVVKCMDIIRGLKNGEDNIRWNELEPPKYTGKTAREMVKPWQTTCVCGETVGDSYGAICCDNEDCKRREFHLKCVGLDQAPEEWICGECSQPDLMAVD